MVRYVDVANNIWGKDIYTIIGKTTRTKPNLVSGYMIKIPEELLKLSKTVFLTVDLFFVNRL